MGLVVFIVRSVASLSFTIKQSLPSRAIAATPHKLMCRQVMSSASKFATKVLGGCWPLLYVFVAV